MMHIMSNAIAVTAAIIHPRSGTGFPLVKGTVDRKPIRLMVPMLVQGTN